MAKLREIRKRIKSVRNTKQITKTMEMVSTAKLKRAMDRVKAAQPYAAEVKAMLQSCARAAAGGAVHPLTRAGADGAPEGFLLLTANRGLCGGFNTNVIKKARTLMQGKPVSLSVSGKKGLGFCRFQGIEVTHRYTQFEEKPRFSEIREVARDLASDFLEGRIRSLTLVYTAFKSAGDQRPAALQVLPVPLKAASEAAEPKGLPPLSSPSPKEMLDRLVPEWLELMLYRAFVESAACEQAARRVAMKSATDNADEMIKALSGQGNRARQSQITQEISEIVGGAEAVS